ncbi:anthranilate synthase component I family protein [Nocardioides sp. R-C-SC26]|uniref:anthranilate synthase component I family protein n=1 Tax=Nocardioides sp. R-C-SC26 TaxID=2870414 RepID=UPI001E530430|nr:anthranilate synthase component I family protein [Nocardioides sp. R-C-SC26]
MSGSPTRGSGVAWVRDIVASRRRCFWLDGGGARGWSGERSIVGWLDDDDVSLSYRADRREVTRHVGGRSEVVGDDVFAVLREELAAGAPSDQWFGYFGYAARTDLPARPGAALGGDGLPDAVWMRPSRVEVFSASRENRTLAYEVSSSNVRLSRPAEKTGRAPADYRAAFDAVQERLRGGDTYETNLTVRLEHEGDADPLAVYERLRALNPAPYAGFLQHDVDDARAWLLSSSPERYALVTADRRLEAKPIKGTTPRDADPVRDAARRRELATDPRFRAENLMIVDLLRHDLAQVCDVGTVQVPGLMEVESYASVHQLVSTVTGRLRDDVDTVAALQALFPAGSMTGAPKRRTMEIIDAVEETPRGVYAGAFGWIAADGRADLGVVIRSLTTLGDGRYRLGTGGGITVHSDVEDEWAEAGWKAERLLAALRAHPQPGTATSGFSPTDAG